MYNTVIKDLQAKPESWLVTGAAGFIGSNLVERLLACGQRVRGLDNLSSGYTKNLDLVKESVGSEAWKRFEFIEGDIRDAETCRKATQGIKNVLHEAALGSVPMSIADPAYANSCNVDGFLNVLSAAKDNGVQSFVYASSSAVFGDDPTLPKREEIIGSPLSPYAVTKYANELYASVFASCYGFKSIGLRYFNIYGQRQDPNGAYAAVIPKWFDGMLKGDTIFINGDGTITRDFCFIEDCVQANILAAKAAEAKAWGKVYNVGCGNKTTLTELFYAIRSAAATVEPKAGACEPVYREFRSGDIVHSLADISRAKSLLGYKPAYTLESGLKKVAPWFYKHL